MAYNMACISQALEAVGRRNKFCVLGRADTIGALVFSLVVYCAPPSPNGCVGRGENDNVCCLYRTCTFVWAAHPGP